MKWFRRKPKKAVDDRNPMLDIPHVHDPLPANNGSEIVCGLCGLREPANKLDKMKG